MQIDWITWGIWSVGFAILAGWLVNVVGEIRAILGARKKENNHERNDGAHHADHH